MKPKRNRAFASPPADQALVLKELSSRPAVGEVISVRAAKAHLSALLELVASGREIVITSDGQPKVRLVSFSRTPPRRRFPGAAAHLQSMPAWKEGDLAEDLVRVDRDGRGW